MLLNVNKMSDFKWNKSDIQFYGVLCVIIGFIIGVVGTLFIQEINKLF